MEVSLQEAAASLKRASAAASEGLVEREALAELIVLSAVAREHMLVIGPPGTAKSAAVRRLAQVIGGNYFEYLLGRFTEPSELFGPVDLRKLRDGVVETETSGMLPEAEIAFLDEVFLGSTAILNTLLGILNERVFRRGHTRIECPLRLCVGASNSLPEDESLAAFADRFLVHVFVDSVPDSLLEDLLSGGRSISNAPMDPIASIADVETLAQAADRAPMEPVRPSLAHAIRMLRKAGVHLYDRRLVKAQRLVAAAAALAGRETPSKADLWPIVYTVPTLEGQELARDVLHEFLAGSDNPALSSAAEDASASPEARARKIIERTEPLLAEAEPEDSREREVWLLKLESAARDIDAGFADAALPEGLRAVRDQLAEHIGKPEPEPAGES